MKYLLSCVLFGHKFLATNDYYKHDELWTQTTISDICVKCGLSKKEIGITT
jgi:hypothetical protein